MTLGSKSSPRDRRMPPGMSEFTERIEDLASRLASAKEYL
jgi:hypothetical protein